MEKGEKVEKVESVGVEKVEKGKEVKEIEKIEKREIVVPGEVLGSALKFLPSEGTRREGKEIIATRFGLVERSGKLIKVIPLAGVYVPKKGQIVLGQVIDTTFNGWIIDIKAPHLAFLPFAECKIRIKEPGEYLSIGKIIIAKIKAVHSRSITLTMKTKEAQKLEQGIIIRTNPTRVPRIIGKKGSMINTIKKYTGCVIAVGQNGLIWIKGRNAEDEMLAKEAIEIVAEKPFIEGLTEQIKSFLMKKRKEEKEEKKKNV